MILPDLTVSISLSAIAGLIAIINVLNAKHSYTKYPWKKIYNNRRLYFADNKYFKKMVYIVVIWVVLSIIIVDLIFFVSSNVFGALSLVKIWFGEEISGNMPGENNFVSYCVLSIFLYIFTISEVKRKHMRIEEAGGSDHEVPFLYKIKYTLIPLSLPFQFILKPILSRIIDEYSFIQRKLTDEIVDNYGPIKLDIFCVKHLKSDVFENEELAIKDRYEILKQKDELKSAVNFFINWKIGKKGYDYTIRAITDSLKPSRNKRRILVKPLVITYICNETCEYEGKLIQLSSYKKGCFIETKFLHEIGDRLKVNLGDSKSRDGVVKHCSRFPLPSGRKIRGIGIQFN